MRRPEGEGTVMLTKRVLASSLCMPVCLSKLHSLLLMKIMAMWLDLIAQCVKTLSGHSLFLLSQHKLAMKGFV